MRISDWSSDVCSSDLIACGLPPQCEWEAALAMAVNRRDPSPDSAVTWLNDPAIGVLQQLVTNVRAGMLVDLLTLSYRLMVLYLGEPRVHRSEEHTSELQSLMRISYAVFCLKKKKKRITK